MCIPSKSPNQGLFQGGNAFALNQLEQMNYSSPLTTIENSCSYDTQYIPQEEDASQEHHHCVQHNYHDHANDDCVQYLMTPVVCKGGVTVPFPMKLHEMLDHIALYETELSSIVSWQPHGRCFLVKKIKEFSRDILPRFFDQKKYASFQRQLNLYGFNRITTGPDRGSYYHEMFLRGKKILCRGIYRMKVKGTGVRMASNPEQEPNFYLMEYMPAAGSDKDTDKISDMELRRDENNLVTPPPPPLKMVEDGETIPPLNLSSTEPVPLTLSSPFESNINDYNPNSNAHDNMLPPPTLSHVNFDKTNNDNTTSTNDYEQYYDPIDDLNDLKFVFDDMPFHSVEDIEPIPITTQTLNATQTDDAYCGSGSSSLTSESTIPVTVSEMEFISDLGMKMDLTDPELGDILDRLIDDDIIFQ